MYTCVDHDSFFVCVMVTTVLYNDISSLYRYVHESINVGIYFSYKCKFFNHLLKERKFTC